MLSIMSDPANLSHADFEPSDEQLADLSKKAFAEVPASRQRALEQLRANIAQERTLVLARLRDPQRVLET